MDNDIQQSGACGLNKSIKELLPPSSKIGCISHFKHDSIAQKYEEHEIRENAL